MNQSPISMSRLLLFGAFTWAIPFLGSIVLIGRDGQMLVSAGLFKSAMIVLGTAIGAWLLVLAFRHPPAFRHPGIVVGLLWLTINIVLDLLILIPMTKMNITDYAAEIALRYLLIPILSVAIATAGDSSRSAE